MAPSPNDPTMQIPSPELVKRIESLVSSLLGVTESRVERNESGAIRSLHAAVAPGHSPDRVRREIRSALLSSLDLELPPDVVAVEVEEQVGRRQEQFWQAPERGRERARPRLDQDSLDAAQSESGAEVAEAPVDGGADGGTDRDHRESSTSGEAIGSRIEEAEPAGPESWLSKADSPPRPRPGGAGRAPERWPAEDRRSGGDRRDGSDRRDWEDRRDEEDRRSGVDRRAEQGEAEIPSAAYIDAIIDRLRERERQRGGTSAEAAPEVAEEPGTLPGPEAPAAGAGTAPGPDPSGVPDGGTAVAGQATGGRVASPARATDSLLPLSLGEYVLLGGGADDRGVELRIRVEAGGERYVGTVRVASLEDVTPGLFVGATLRAVERALDARPVTDRSARILILEAVDMEEVVLREGRFITTTIQAVHRDGERRATGLVPAEGRIIREAAAEAALDAVTRILEGRHTRKVEGRGRIRRDVEAGSGGAGSGGSPSAGPGSPDGDGFDGGRADTAGEAEDRRFTRDPFNIWE